VNTLTKDQLHQYQRYSVQHIIENTHCALFLDMGLGKTVSTLTAIEHLMYRELEVGRVLVVAPKRVAESVWHREAQKWAHLTHLTFSIITGTATQRRTAYRTKADVHLISRDNIAWLVQEMHGKMPYDMLVLDELSSFKSHKAVRFKTLRKVQPSFDRIVGLTGTPSPNGLIDLWAQLYLLDRGQRLGRTLTEYRNNYFKPGQRNGAIVYNYKPLKNTESEIHDKIKDICVSMKSEDYLDLPGTKRNIIDLEFTDAQKAKYEEFEKSQVLRLFEDSDEITAVNAAALSNKLLQYANGAVYDENRDVHAVHDIKLDAAEEIVESANGKPVLIAWAYQHDRDRLKTKLKKYKPRELKTDQDIEDWNAGKIQVLLMHPASGGHGLNLQAGGNTMVWYGHTWSLELYQQLNKRLDRQGQTRQVIMHLLVMRGTVDEDVLRSLENKTQTQDGLMDAVKARINKYLP